MPDQTLLVLLDEVRGKTLQVLEGVSPEHARWAPPGLQNTILWHAGHSYFVVEWLTMQSLGQEPSAPDGWFEMFSWESRPATVPADRWPALESVVRELQAQQRRLRSLFASLTPEQLESNSPAYPDRSVRNWIVHGLHDEARHSGEISLLRKLLGVRGA
jgi:hypothetical protein